MEKVIFTDPQTGGETVFVVEEETQLNGTNYLLVSDGGESGECEAYVLKEVHTEDEEVIYQAVNDDVELAALAKIFAELTDEETDVVF